MNEGRFYGKYKATVFQNVDPENRGRLMLKIPDVLGNVPSTWAEACVPLAGPTGPAMGFFMVPPLEAGVWVEFEDGDPNHPIWVGCRWGNNSDIPSQAKQGLPASPNIVVQSLGQHSVVISDSPDGGITLKSTSGNSIRIGNDGIEIKSVAGASITLKGTAVDINNGALSIMN